MGSKNDFVNKALNIYSTSRDNIGDVALSFLFSYSSSFLLLKVLAGGRQFCRCLLHTVTIDTLF